MPLLTEDESYSLTQRIGDGDLELFKETTEQFVRIAQRSADSRDSKESESLESVPLLKDEQKDC
jgi:hypothetical protein